MLATAPLNLALMLATFAVVLGSQRPAAAEETLGSQLQALSEQSKSRLPAEVRQKFSQGIEDVRATGILDKAKNVGDKAVDGVLTAPNGDQVRARTLWADRPVVVTFYRGGWCPYCNLQLRALNESLAELGDAGATLVAVTPELPEKVSQTAQKNDLSLRVLTDRSNAWARDMGIVFQLPQAILPFYRDRLKLAEYNGDDRFELPLAATYVIDTTGTVRYAFLDADYKQRAEPADVIAAVKSLK